MQQLQHQYRLMQQLRQQQQRSVARPGPTPPSYGGDNNQFAGQLPQNISAISSNNKTFASKGDKLVQPIPNVVPTCARDVTAPISGHPSTDMDVSEEELKDLLSQKDLATTLAENLLKHFGSDAMDIKEESDSQHGKSQN